MAGRRTYHARACVLDRTKLGETDLILTLLSSNGAQLRAVAKGARKPGGKLAMIHRPERLADIICLMRGARIEPKRLRFVHPSAGKTATMILIEGAKHGRPKLLLEPPLYVHDESGEYTDEINRIYGRNG